jgi:hypothetical protein
MSSRSPTRCVEAIRAYPAVRCREPAPSWLERRWKPRLPDPVVDDELGLQTDREHPLGSHGAVTPERPFHDLRDW